MGFVAARTHPRLGDDRPRRTHRHVPLRTKHFSTTIGICRRAFFVENFFENCFWQGDFLRGVWISHGEERCGGDEADKVSVVSCADSVAYPRAVVVEIADAVALT